MQLCIATHEFSSSSVEDLKIRLALDSPYPLIRPGTIRNESYSVIPFFFRNDAEWFAFERLRLLGEVLRLETPYGDSEPDFHYLRLGERRVTRLTTPTQGAAQMRLVEVTALEVNSSAATPA